MYNIMFFKPKYKYRQYEKFIENFVNNFRLTERKRQNKKYFLENQDMRVTVEPKFIEVLVARDNDDGLEKKLKEYFEKGRN